MKKNMAKKKSPTGKKPDTPRYEFQIKEDDVLERAHFGSFEVIKTTGGIMFKNYSGFHIYTTPYAVGPDGVAVENSLYAWLFNLMETQKAFADKMDEQFMDATNEDGTPITNADLLEADKIITEGNLIKPMTVFMDLNHASEQAREHMAWLTEMTEKLAESMNTAPASEEEAVRADAEEGAKALNNEVLGEMLQEAVEQNPELLQE